MQKIVAWHDMVLLRYSTLFEIFFNIVKSIVSKIQEKSYNLGCG